MALLDDHQIADGRDAPAVKLPPGYRWVAMGIVLVGTFMVILDTSIVNVALPKIGADFGTISGVEWIVTAYLLAVGVAQMATGWLADRIGRKATFLGSLVLFTASSALCALAPNLALLNGFRILQGIGGGALMPVAMAMIFDLFEPRERGTALGIWGIAAMAAPAIGPVLGGWLVTVSSWRTLFTINVPIGVVGTILGVRLLRDVGFREHRPFDLRGLWYSGIGLVLLLLALQESTTWGWSSARFLSVFAVGLVLVAAYVLHALRVRHPLVDVRMFRIGAFTISMAVIWMLTIAQFTRLVFMPLQLETLRGLSALKVGVVLTPSALGIAATMPIGGRMADRVGVRLPVVIGLAVLAASFWPLAHLGLHTPLWIIGVWLFVGGLGAGLSMMPNTVAGMNSVPGRLVSQAASVRSLQRQIAGALGTAILAAILAAQIDPNHVTSLAARVHGQAAYNDLFLIAMFLLAGCFVVALFLPDKARTLALQEERRREGLVVAEAAMEME
jgi:DHA2 family multidrug resistance protein